MSRRERLWHQYKGDGVVQASASPPREGGLISRLLPVRPDSAVVIALQVRCVHCLRKQYAPAIVPVSTGKGVCSWCYRPSRRMTIAEYHAALHARLDRDEAEEHR